MCRIKLSTLTCKIYSRDLERGSRGPSTVTLIALLYVATCGGHVATVMVIVKLFPEKKKKCLRYLV